MNKRKGLLIVLVLLLGMLAKVSAEESADEIVAMMGWWEEYGRYWDEIGAEEVTTDEMAYGWLDVDIWQLPVRSAE